MPYRRICRSPDRAPPGRAARAARARGRRTMENRVAAAAVAGAWVAEAEAWAARDRSTTIRTRAVDRTALEMHHKADPDSGITTKERFAWHDRGTPMTHIAMPHD